MKVFHLECHAVEIEEIKVYIIMLLIAAVYKIYICEKFF